MNRGQDSRSTVGKQDTIFVSSITRAGLGGVGTLTGRERAAATSRLPPGPSCSPAGLMGAPRGSVTPANTAEGEINLDRASDWDTVPIGLVKYPFFLLVYFFMQNIND